MTLDYETKKSYSLTAGVADPGGLSDSVAVTVNVTDVEPTASAGADFNAKRGEDLTLSGSGTAHADGSQTLTARRRRPHSIIEAVARRLGVGQVHGRQVADHGLEVEQRL